jgi:hypothetical protein
VGFDAARRCVAAFRCSCSRLLGGSSISPIRFCCRMTFLQNFSGRLRVLLMMSLKCVRS